MLPLSLLSWIFNGWKILPNGTKNIQGIVDDVVQGALGIALTCVFLIFAIMFLDAVFGAWDGVSVLANALAQNDSSVIMDGLMMRNDSLVTIILMGAFVAMFMTSIPTLIKTLFSVSVLDGFYKTTKDNLDKTWANVQKIYKVLKK
jgi:hypothetical protein